MIEDNDCQRIHSVEMPLKEKIIAQIEEQLPMLSEEEILFLAGYLLGKREEKEKHEPEPH